jgi:hypothetical protein
MSLAKMARPANQSNGEPARDIVVNVMICCRCILYDVIPRTHAG